MQLKKTLSIMLILSILLLSSCQIGMPGKATATGETEWAPLYQCRQHVTGNVYDYYLTLDSTCKGQADYKDTIGYVAKTPVPGYNMQLISECMRVEQFVVSRNPVTGKESRRYYSDEYVVLGAQCERAQDKIVTQLGYIYKDQQPGTTQFYRCWMDRRHEDVWDHWISRNSNCYSERLQRNVNAEFPIGWIRTGEVPPAGPSPIISQCDQARQANTDLKNKIATIEKEIDSLTKQIETVR